jgi:hypothetical protein
MPSDPLIAHTANDVVCAWHVLSVIAVASGTNVVIKVSVEY